MNNTQSHTNQAVPTQQHTGVKADDLTYEQKRRVETLSGKVEQKASRHLPDQMDVGCMDVIGHIGVTLHISIHSPLGQVAQYNVAITEASDTSEDGKESVEEEATEVAQMVVAQTVSEILSGQREHQPVAR